MHPTLFDHRDTRLVAIAALVTLMLPPPSVRAQAAPPDNGPSAEAEAFRGETKRRAEEYHAAADRARDAYTHAPQDGKAIAARREEAVMLIQAVQCGDTSLAGRMTSTVQAVCDDAAVPEAVRAEVAGTNRFLEVLRRTADPQEIDRAFEKIARDLIREYPRQPQGYESLLTTARGSEPSKGRKLANELIALPSPDAVKQQARVLLDRLDTVGQPLARVLPTDVAPEISAALRSSRPTLVYTWATWSPGSMALGEMLATRKAGAVTIVGLNLDQDVAEARRAAEAHHLPGQQAYDVNGPSGALARRLGADAAPLVYLIDAQGVIRDVRGLDQLEQKLTQLGL